MRTLGLYVAVTAIGLCIAIAAFDRSLIEKIDFFLHPSVEQAVRYGQKHLDTVHATEHDLQTARYFYTRASHMDPTHVGVHHQLARIEFLSGRYPEALAEVNAEIENGTHENLAASYYLRGLIAGYMDDYASAVRDYRTYVSLNPNGWEGRTDLAWVLVKTHAYEEALRVVDDGLVRWPDNPWLLSMRATILYESGRKKEALEVMRRAQKAVEAITEAEWLRAYPGNHPSAAAVGIETLKKAARDNLAQMERDAAAE